MNDFDAAVEWLVQSGRAKSKGDARRTLIEQAHQEGTKALLDPDLRAWYGSALVNGLVGAAAPIAANRDIAYSGQTAGAAAQIGIDLANRSIAHMATEARKIGKAEDFTAIRRNLVPIGARPSAYPWISMWWHEKVMVGSVKWDGTAWKCRCGKRWGEDA